MMLRLLIFWGVLSLARAVYVNQKTVGSKYDFIVVGGGTAGCALAARLSAQPQWTVLLIESGTKPISEMGIPPLASTFQRTRWDYNYTTIPQTNCSDLNQGTVFWPSGKVLGGTSMINYMIYSPGRPEDFKNWSKGANWNWATLQPYFQRLNKMPRNVSLTSSASTAFKDGLVQTKIGKKDLKTVLPFITKSRRMDSFKQYIKHNCDTNLHILLEATATKLITKVVDFKLVVDKVEVKTNGTTLRIKPRKDLIVTAGVVGTTKLLLKSGIGPQQDLKKLNIPVIRDLPVGRNIMDHVAYQGLNYLTNLPQLNIDKWPNWYKLRKFTVSPAGFESVWQTNNTAVEYLVANTILSRVLWNITNVKSGFQKDHYARVKIYLTVSVLPVLLQPKSRGSIRLKSKSCDEVLINPNYLKDERDVDALVDSIGKIQRIMNTKNDESARYPVPLTSEFHCNETSYWRKSVRKMVMSMGDYMGGSCIGPVVDEQLLVHGFSNLRVADASVIPRPIRGHIATTVLVIAERAADIITACYVP